MIDSLHSTAPSSARRLVLLLILYQFNDLIGNPKILNLRRRSAPSPLTDSLARGGEHTDVVSPHIDLGQSEEFIAIGTCLHHLFEGQIHPGVAVDQMTIQRFSILELDQHRMALGGIEQT